MHGPDVLVEGVDLPPDLGAVGVPQLDEEARELDDLARVDVLALGLARRLEVEEQQVADVRRQGHGDERLRKGMHLHYVYSRLD